MVRKHEIFKRDGGYSSFLGMSTAARKGTRTYKGYEAYFELKSFSKYEIDMEWKAMVHDWEQAIDAELDKSKKSPESENISNKKQNFSSEDRVTHVPASEFKKALDDIKELKVGVNKTKPETVKSMEEIMKKVREETNKEMAKLNKDIKAKENEITQLGKQMAEAQRRGDTKNQEKLTAVFDQLQKEKAEISKRKEEVITENDIKEWLEAQNKSWFQLIPWNEPKTYVKLGGAFVVFLAIIALFVWLWKKYVSRD